MPDKVFISGKCGKLQLKVGAGATMNIPCLGGEGYSVGDNDVVERLAQACAFGAAPGNILMGLNTPVLDVACRLFVPSGTGATATGWWSAVNLASMFGAANKSDMASRTDPNGDLPIVDVSFSNGADSVTDQMKLARLSIEGSGQTNQVLARLTFLGLNLASAAAFGAYVAMEGAPLYWKDMQAWTWKPKGGSSAGMTLAESLAFTINTGLSFAKWNDNTDSPSGLDPLDMSGAVTVAQRAGATNRMVASRNGTLGVFVGSDCEFRFGLNRMGRPHVLNPQGGITDASNWQMVRTDGNFAYIGSV